MACVLQWVRKLLVNRLVECCFNIKKSTITKWAARAAHFYIISLEIDSLLSVQSSECEKAKWGMYRC